jgi:hypothetical protein
MGIGRNSPSPSREAFAVARIRFLLVALFAVLWLPTAHSLEPESPSSSSVPAKRIILLETVEIVGTTRVSSSQIAEQLRLSPSIVVDDALVADLRKKILGLGLFRYVLVSMRKGSRPN